MANAQFNPNNPRNIFLRRITFYAFFFSFLLSLAHGIGTSHVFPALGLIVLAGSSLQAAFLLHRGSVVSLGSAVRGLTPRNVFYTDLVLATLYGLFLIASWVSLGDEGGYRAYGDKSWVILGSYCTVFMLIN